MQIEKKFTQKSYAIFIFSLILILILSCFKNGPLTHSVSKSLYFFINSFYGYNFLMKRFVFPISSLFVLVLAFIGCKKYGFKEFFFKGPSKYFFFFILSMAISIIFSSYRIKYFQIDQLLLFIMTYFLFASILAFFKTSSINTKKALYVFFGVLILLSLYQAYVSIYHYFYLPTLRARFADRWVFDSILNIGTTTYSLSRARGSFFHPNVYAAFMLLAATGSIYFYINLKNKWRRFLSLLILFIQIFCIWISYSRGVILGFIIFLVLFGGGNYLLYLKNNNQIEGNKIFQKVKYITIFAFISHLVCLCLFFPQITVRGGVVNNTTISKYSNKQRVIVKNVSTEMIKTNFIKGIGYNNFSRSLTDFAPNSKNIRKIEIVHNIYHLILAENGILGILTFLAFIFSIFMSFIKSKISTLSTLLSSYITVILIIGMFDYYPVYRFDQRILLFVPLAILAGISKKEKKGVNLSQIV